MVGEDVDGSYLSENPVALPTVTVGELVLEFSETTAAPCILTAESPPSIRVSRVACLHSWKHEGAVGRRKRRRISLCLAALVLVVGLPDAPWWHSFDPFFGYCMAASALNLLLAWDPASAWIGAVIGRPFRTRVVATVDDVGLTVRGRKTAQTPWSGLTLVETPDQLTLSCKAGYLNIDKADHSGEELDRIRRLYQDSHAATASPDPLADD